MQSSIWQLHLIAELKLKNDNIDVIIKNFIPANCQVFL